MNDYDTRCGWCDARYSTKWERAEHEKEEHGTVTDEQVNRIMSGQDKLWDTHKGPMFTTQDGPDNRDDRLIDKPYGPGLNVTVPRAPQPEFHFDRYTHLSTCMCNECLSKPPEDKMACLEGEAFACGPDDGISDEDLVPTMLVTAGAICQQAADITAGDRQVTHGDKVENHRNISALWSAYLGVEIAPYQAAGMMVLLKLARTQAGAFHVDDYIDMAGYAGCMAEIRHRSNQEGE